MARGRRAYSDSNSPAISTKPVLNPSSARFLNNYAALQVDDLAVEQGGLVLTARDQRVTVGLGVVAGFVGFRELSPAVFGAGDGASARWSWGILGPPSER